MLRSAVRVSSSLAILFLILFFLVIQGLGCVDSVDRCMGPSDCPVLGSFCIAGSCVVQSLGCVDDGDCGAEAICQKTTGACEFGCREDAQCAASQRCVRNTCVDRFMSCTMDSECGLGKRCAAGFCVDVPKQCGTVGESCVPGVAVADGFVCTDAGEGLQCFLSCEVQNYCAPNVDNQNNFVVNLSQERACPMGSTCGDGNFCLPSNCANPVDGLEACQAMAKDNPINFPDGANCSRIESRSPNVTNESFRCESAGVQQEGQTCTSAAGERCAEGLLCVNVSEFTPLSAQNGGVCHKACTSDLQCGEGRQCIGEDIGAFESVGVCGDRCEPFNLDPEACPLGSKCFAISNEDGMCSSHLGPSTRKTPYSACDDPEACPSGTVCFNAHCVPQCDPTLKVQSERDNSCGGGNPIGHVKFVHLAGDADNLRPVDLYVDDARVAHDVSYGQVFEGDAGAWVELTPGPHTVDVVAAESENNRVPLYSLDMTVEENTATILAAVPESNDLGFSLLSTASPRVVPVPVNTGSMSVTHFASELEAVDVVVTALGEDVKVEANRVEVGTGIKPGDSTPFVEMPAGEYDVHVFMAGADRNTNDALVLFDKVVVEASVRTSYIAHNLTQLHKLPYKPFTFTPEHKGYCLDLASRNNLPTLPNWGFCLEKCDAGVSDYGGGACGSEMSACSPFGTNLSVCFAQGTELQGADCAEDKDCADGALCRDDAVAGKSCVKQCEADAECGDAQYCDTHINTVEVDDGNGGSITKGLCVAHCTNNSGCQPGTFCDAKGNGKGVCRSWCTVNGAQNDALAGCRAEETCMANELIQGLGACRLACTPRAPGDFVDTNCPEAQQSCYPEDGHYFCHESSNATPVGSTCAGGDVMQEMTCDAGSLCVTDVKVRAHGFSLILSAFESPNVDIGETATCREMCRPFLSYGQESDCPAGEFCMPVLPTQDLNTYAGVCAKAADSVDVEGNCAGEDVGYLCGDASVCGVSEQTPNVETNTCDRTASCVSLCNPATNSGCPPSKKCESLGSQEVTSLFLGSFGICRDRI